MRLIDADALGIGKAKRDTFTIPEYADGWNSAIDIIDNAPTVDAVEVVRCKDCTKCESFYPCKEIGKEVYPLVYYCKVYGNNTLPNNYCNYGKRKVSE